MPPWLGFPGPGGGRPPTGRVHSLPQLPPAVEGPGRGPAAGCDGYGVFDPATSGRSPQQGSTPTPGTGRLDSPPPTGRLLPRRRRMPDVYLDVVLHQLAGGETAVAPRACSRYLGRGDFGSALNGRGPDAPRVLPRRAPGEPPGRRRPVLSADDFEFRLGEGVPALRPGPGTRSTTPSTTARRLAVPHHRGGRDAVRRLPKGTWGVVRQSVRRVGSRSMADEVRLQVREYFDGNPDNPQRVGRPACRQPSRSLVEDFTLHWALQDRLRRRQAPGRTPRGGRVRGPGNPFLACTFVDNLDTDTSRKPSGGSSKLFAYAFPPGRPRVSKRS